MDEELEYERNELMAERSVEEMLWELENMTAAEIFNVIQSTCGNLFRIDMNCNFVAEYCTEGCRGYMKDVMPREENNDNINIEETPIKIDVSGYLPKS